MNWNRHSELQGMHATLSPSSYYWLGYDETKMADTYRNRLAIARGTELHAFAESCIRLGQKLPKTSKTLNAYVNDAITFALARARSRYGAQRHPVNISPREWEAIQSGAVSENMLSQILRFADIDQVRTYATPRTSTTLSDAKQARIRAMRASGYTTSEIASALDVATSTVSKYLK